MADTLDFQRSLDSAHQFASQLLDDLRLGTEDPAGGVTRASYGPGEQFAHDLMAEQAKKIGLDVDQDAALNTYMTLRGKDPSLPRIIIGSHLDSVACGGNYDGAAGVVAGLAAIHILQNSGFTPQQDICVMGIRAEESAWFQTSYIGSKAALGLLDPTALQALRIDTQKTLADHISELGGCPETLTNGPAYLNPATIQAYIEVHIEQAPSLVERGHPLAIGTAIPGNIRYPDVQVTGSTAHVGLPLQFRQDALKAAAGFVTAMETLWRDWDTQQKAMAFTVGRFHTDLNNDATTKVPGLTRFSIDMRAYDEAHLIELEQSARQIAQQLEKQHKVRFDFGVRTTATVAKTDNVLSKAFTDIARREGIRAEPLPSPASHDAAVFGSVNVPMGLLLVRNENGSHNPDERMDMDDLMVGVKTLTHWLMQ